MKRNFRLKQSSEFQRVRRFGKSYAHPLVVLIVLRLPEPVVHIGVTAGKSVGGAVQRNKAKRLLREAVRPLLPRIYPGCDIILIARTPTQKASLVEIQNAIHQILEKAKLLINDNGS